MMLLLTALSSLLFVIIGLFFAFVAVYSHIVGNAKGALFLPSHKKKINTMIELAQIKEGTRIIDLGSGDGAVVLESACKGAHAVGVEFNPFLVCYSRWRVRHKGFTNHIRIIQGDLMEYSLNNVDIVFLYLLPKTLLSINEKLRLELPQGAHVVSNTFPLPGWSPIEERNGVFLYRQN